MRFKVGDKARLNFSLSSAYVKITRITRNDDGNPAYRLMRDYGKGVVMESIFTWEDKELCDKECNTCKYRFECYTESI